MFWVFTGLGCTIVITSVIDGLLFRRRIGSGRVGDELGNGRLKLYP